MINAFYREYSDETGHEVRLLEVQGHAGFAPKGSDIVCAMASILVDTLVMQLRSMLTEETGGLFVDADEGRAVVRTVVNTGDIAAEWLRAQYDFACEGLSLLAGEYPGFAAYVDGTEVEPEIGEAARPAEDDRSQAGAEVLTPQSAQSADSPPFRGAKTAAKMLEEREKDAERWAAEQEALRTRRRYVNAQRFAEGGGDGGSDGSSQAGAEVTAPQSPDGDSAKDEVQEPTLRPAQLRQAIRSGAMKPGAADAAEAAEKVVYGKQEDEAPADGDGDAPADDGAKEPAPAEEAPTDPDAEFLAAIGKDGKYAAQFGRLMQAMEAQQAGRVPPALQPLMEALGKQYGRDASDIAGITDLVTGKVQVKNREYFEAKAAKEGISVQQAMQLDELETRNAQLQQAEDAAKARERQAAMEAQIREIHADWRRQETALREKYPDFDLRRERDTNPAFADLMGRGVNLEAAYRATHFDELMKAQQAATAQAVEKGVAQRIASRGARPNENGTRPGGAAIVKSDVNSLTRADREEIERRVARGEKIRF